MCIRDSGEGVAEELLGALAKDDGLRVAARRSSFWFKDREAELGEIASKLNVGHVLEGSVRRDGNRVRITAELIDACDGFTIWTETCLLYTSDAADERSSVDLGGR